MNSRTLQRQAVRAWYREPWPWVLMALPATAVIAGIVTLVIAIRNEDGLVADDYYKQGLAINRVLERESLAAKLGLSGRALFGNGRVRISIVGDSGRPEGLVMRFVHRTRAGEDREVLLSPIGSELYEGSLPAMVSGRWHIQLEDAKATWRLTADWTSGEDVLTFIAPKAS